MTSPNCCFSFSIDFLLSVRPLSLVLLNENQDLVEHVLSPSSDGPDKQMARGSCIKASDELREVERKQALSDERRFGS